MLAEQAHRAAYGLVIEFGNADGLLRRNGTLLGGNLPDLAGVAHLLRFGFHECAFLSIDSA